MDAPAPAKRTGKGDDEGARSLFGSIPSQPPVPRGEGAGLSPQETLHGPASSSPGNGQTKSKDSYAQAGALPGLQGCGKHGREESSPYGDGRGGVPREWDHRTVRVQKEGVCFGNQDTIEDIQSELEPKQKSDTQGMSRQRGEGGEGVGPHRGHAHEGDGWRAEQREGDLGVRTHGGEPHDSDEQSTALAPEKGQRGDDRKGGGVPGMGGHRALRRRVPLSAAQQQELASRILDSMGPAVYSFSPDGLVLSWSGSSERLFGWTAEQALGRHVSPFLCATECVELSKHIIDTLLVHGNPWAGRLLLRNRAGENLDTIIFNTPLFDDTGKLWATIGVAHTSPPFIPTEPRHPPFPTSQGPSTPGRSNLHGVIPAAPWPICGEYERLPKLEWHPGRGTPGIAIPRQKSGVRQRRRPLSPMDIFPEEDEVLRRGPEPVVVRDLRADGVSRMERAGRRGPAGGAQEERGMSHVALQHDPPRCSSLGKVELRPLQRQPRTAALLQSPLQPLGTPHAPRHTGIPFSLSDVGPTRDGFNLDLPWAVAGDTLGAAELPEGGALEGAFGPPTMDTVLHAALTGIQPAMPGQAPRPDPLSAALIAEPIPSLIHPLAHAHETALFAADLAQAFAPRRGVTGTAQPSSSAMGGPSFVGYTGYTASMNAVPVGGAGGQKSGVDEAAVGEVLTSPIMRNGAGTMRSSLHTLSFGGGASMADVAEDDAIPLQCGIKWQDISLGALVGRGQSGSVYRAVWKGVDVAVKVFPEAHVLSPLRVEFRREVRIMEALRHPNVVLYMGALETDSTLCIVSEFLPRGSLLRVLQSMGARQLSYLRRLRMGLDAAKGVHYLHSCSPPVVHHDLKSANLLVDRTWAVKVADFGLSKLKFAAQLSARSGRGTPQWMAPEVLRSEHSSEKSDVYSFGVVLWELCTCRMPWEGMNPMQVVGAVGFKDQRLGIPSEVDPDMRRLISACWDSDPQQRPSLTQVMDALQSAILRARNKSPGTS